VDQHPAALDRAHRHALDWLSSLGTRPVPPQASIDQVTQALGAALPEVVRRLLADGTAWMSGSTWHDRSVLRISVSNWSTTDDDVERSLDAVRKAVIGL